MFNNALEVKSGLVSAVADTSFGVQLTEWYDKDKSMYVSLWGTQTDLIYSRISVESLKGNPIEALDSKDGWDKNIVGFLTIHGPKGMTAKDDYVAKKLQSFGVSKEIKPALTLGCSYEYFAARQGHAWKVKGLLCQATADSLEDANTSTQEYLEQAVQFYAKDPDIKAWYDSNLLSSVSKFYNKDASRILASAMKVKGLSEAQVA